MALSTPVEFTVLEGRNMSSRVVRKHRTLNRALPLVAVLLFTAGVFADTWYVDDDAPNDPGPGDPTVSDPNEDGSAAHPFDAIQEGMDAAQPGDEVVLADGTYMGVGNRDLDFGGKAITVRSANGDPGACIIDCENSGRGFYFHSGEGTGSTLVGLTITNGNAPWNPGASNGGAVYCTQSIPTLTDCRISGNRAANGGGIFCDSSGDATLDNCTINENTADENGGGMYCTSSDPTLTGCIISGNLASGQYNPGEDDGGGVYCDHSSPTLSDCAISGNRAANDGGGIFCSPYSNPTLTNCTISGNAATASYDDGDDDGGGVYCSANSSPTFVNCTIANNIAEHHGGGIYCPPSSSPTLTNCTISANFAETNGGGLYCYSTSPTPNVTNCVVWHNGPQAMYVPSGSPLVTYSNIESGTGQPWFGIGCIDSDPLLTPALHLSIDSPCRDSGDPNGVYAGQVDIDGEPRVVGDFVDMGSDEWLDTDTDGLPNWWEWLYFESPTAGDPAGNEDGDGRLNLEEYSLGSNPLVGARVFHVALDGDDTWDGLCETWDGGTCGPKATIQAAIDACHATEGDEVAIADGTYTGVGNKNLDFAGKAITVRSASGNPSACMIDCEGDGRGFYFRNGEAEDSVVSGLSITNGHVTGGSPGGAHGGGVYCRLFSSPKFTNCIIRQNGAEESGGGVCCRSFSAPILQGCAIGANYAETRGGGVYCYFSNPTLTNCTVGDNAAEFGGGGLRCRDSDPTLTNCVVWSNTPQSVDLFNAAPLVTYSNIESGTGQPWFGIGCIDSDPLLTPALHLSIDSPCRDSGDPNGVYAGQVDIDGEPRVVGDFVDMGSDEWLDTDTDGLPNWWEWLYFESPTAGDPAGNEDGDGRLNLEEYSLGSNPLVGARVFHVALDGDDTWDGLCETWDGGTCGPKATIQAAIDACHATEGDEVAIADGTYTGVGNKNLDFAGKAITVRSASGNPSACMIDCEGDGRGFYFRNGEAEDSVVSGLSITNGHVTGGSPGGAHGGGVYCRLFSSPKFTNCIIRQNGAGINDYLSGGGGVYCLNSNAKFTHCTIGDNHTLARFDDGGGVYCSFSNPTFTNCRISGNSAPDDHCVGGGVYCRYSTPLFTNCLITQNTSGGSGYYYGGGGVYCESSDIILTNCAISGNVAFAGRGGGIYCDDSSPTIVNCVLWSNVPSAVYVYSGSPYAVFSNIEAAAGEPWFGSGCIDTDPLFADADGPDNDPDTWQDNDFRLSGGSPCIDAADNTAVPPDSLDLDGDGDTTEPIPFDLTGGPRFVDDPDTPDTGNPGPPGPLVDMGAYEFAGQDCNENGIPDAVDLADCDGSPWCSDCNANGVLDVCDIAVGTSGVTLSTVSDPENPAAQDFADILTARVEQTADTLTFVIEVRGEIPEVLPEPTDYITYIWLIDADQDPDTGQPHGPIGSEFNLRTVVGENYGGTYIDITGGLPGGGPAVGEVDGSSARITLTHDQIASPAAFNWSCSVFGVVTGVGNVGNGGETSPGTAAFADFSLDSDSNGIPDECESGSPPGDFNDDGVVDLLDFELFAGCMAGPDISTPPPGCDESTFTDTDLDHDSDTDLADFAIWSRLFEYAFPCGWWEEASTTGPAPRADPAMAYDPVRQRTVLFGGQDVPDDVYFNDTWEWDGAEWELKSTTGPPPRRGAGMTYDPELGAIVLYGGGDLGATKYSDFWVWDGATWTELDAAAPPGERFSVHLAYDTARQRLVLWGGIKHDGLASDTWEWDGANWEEVAAAGPPGRYYFGMAYDETRQRTVVVGGWGESVSALRDVWEWDGVAWSQVADFPGGPIRSNCLAYDAGCASLVLVGGWNGDVYSADAWRYDGTDWIKELPPPPPPRTSAGLAPGPNGQSLLLFGGFAVDGSISPLRDTWVLHP